MAMKNQLEWEKLHENPRYWPEYPSERVVQWAFRTWPDREPVEGGASQTIKVLDHGCGTGRHTIFLKENGFDAEGCDVSKNGLEVAAIRAIGRDLDIPFTHYDGTTLPYMDETFDGLVSYGVLYYLPKEAIGVAVDELKRVLKRGGKAIVVVRSVDDSRATKEIGRGDDSMEMVFFTKAELQHLFRGFSDVQIDRQWQSYGLEKDDDYIITLVK